MLGIAFIFGCEAPKEKAKPFDLGTISDGTYTNSYFQLEMDIPSDWEVLTREEIEEDDPTIYKDNTTLPKLREDNVINTTLLEAKYVVEENGLFDMLSLMLIAESTELNLRKPKNAGDVIDAVVFDLQRSKRGYECSEKEEVTIAGKTFTRVRCLLPSEEGDIIQTYSAIIVGKFSLGIIGTAFSDESMAEIDAVVKNMRIK